MFLPGFGVELPRQTIIDLLFMFFIVQALDLSSFYFAVMAQSRERRIALFQVSDV